VPLGTNIDPRTDRKVDPALQDVGSWLLIAPKLYVLLSCSH
jgi:hypothetical protein